MRENLFSNTAVSPLCPKWPSLYVSEFISLPAGNKYMRTSFFVLLFVERLSLVVVFNHIWMVVVFVCYLLFAAQVQKKPKGMD